MIHNNELFLTHLRLKLMYPVHIFNLNAWCKFSLDVFVAKTSNCADFYVSSLRGLINYIDGTVTFFIQTFFIRNKVYTNFLYTGQILYGTKFIQDEFYTRTKFIQGQSLYGDKVYTGQSLYGDKVYSRTKFIQTFFILYLN